MSASAFSLTLAALPLRQPGDHGPPAGASAAAGVWHPHRVGNALRAIRVYGTSAFRVAVFGEYAEHVEHAVKERLRGR